MGVLRRSFPEPLRPATVRTRGSGSRGERRTVDTGPTSRVPVRPPARMEREILQRERHEPEYAILLAVIALAAIGILMVYSSSALRAYIREDDALAIVGPQILWGAVGIAVMLAAMRLDYRYLRLVSLPGYLIAIVLLILVFVPGLNRVVGGSARWLVIGPLPAVHPAEIAKLALVIYLAHWLAHRGARIRGFRSGLLPFLLLVAPIVALIFREPDLGTTVVVAGTAGLMLFVAGASLPQLVLLLGAAGSAAIVVGLRGYQIERIRAFIDPWADPAGAGFHTVQGLLALGLGGIAGAGLGEGAMSGGLYLPNAWNDFVFAVVGEEFGFIGAAAVIGLFLVLGFAGVRTALAAPDTFGALLALGITAWLCLQAFINIAVVVALIPVTGITLPFISAGGTSLIVSFAAAGILLSISRETVERGNGELDAAAHRGRRNRGSHLPGAGPRPSTARASGRA